MDGTLRCIDGEIPFEISENWEWCRLLALYKNIADGDHQPPPQRPNGIPFLVISNVSSGRIDFSNTRCVPEEYYNSLAENRKPEVDDILFTVTGSFGIVVQVDSDREFCFQRHIALIKPLVVDFDFLALWLTSPLVYQQCKACATGTAQKTVGINSQKQILIPLPPSKEQQRIMTKVRSVISFIDSL